MGDRGWLASGVLAGARQISSPNQDSRGDAAVDALVIHCISLPPGEFAGDAIEHLFTNALDSAAHPYFEALRGLRVSSHFLVRRDGHLTQFVPCDRRAWHAGVSTWAGRARCNDRSIGVEMEGTERVPFAESQYLTLVALVRAIRLRYPVTDIVAHSDVSHGRKTDPGIHFDWARLRAGLIRAR